MKIYAVYDKVAERFVSTTLAESDAMFVKNAFIPLMMDYALVDVEYYCVGEFETELGLIKSCRPRLCSWESYKFPEKRDSIKEKYLTTEQVIEFAKQKKNDFLKQQKDKLIDMERALSQAKAKLKLLEEAPKKDKPKIKELRDYINQLSLEIKNFKEVA